MMVSDHFSRPEAAECPDYFVVSPSVKKCAKSVLKVVFLSASAGCDCVTATCAGRGRKHTWPGRLKCLENGASPKMTACLVFCARGEKPQQLKLLPH